MTYILNMETYRYSYLAILADGTRVIGSLMSGSSRMSRSKLFGLIKEESGGTDLAQIEFATSRNTETGEFKRIH